MADRGRGSGGGGDRGSAGCGDAVLDYWCGTCSRSVPDKRCPYCGLKAQRKKGPEEPGKSG